MEVGCCLKARECGHRDGMRALNNDEEKEMAGLPVLTRMMSVLRSAFGTTEGKSRRFD